MLPLAPLCRRTCWLLGGAALAKPFIGSARASDRQIRVGGTGAALGGIGLLGPLVAQDQMTLRIILHLGTLGGIRAVRTNRVDVAVAARAPSAEEAQGMLRSTIYARTPLVFATHPATSADSIGLAEAVGMIGGMIGHWPGGERVRISRRPDRDGDTQLLASVSPAMAQAVVALQHRDGIATAASDHDQVEALELNRGSLGIAALAQIVSESRALKVLPLRDPPPPPGRWPIMKELHVITRVDAPPHVQAFLAAMLGEDAARILTGHGHIPQAGA